MAAVTVHSDPGAQENLESINIVGRNINNLRYEDDTTLMAENEEELKSLVRKLKEESEKAGLKLNIQKTKIMVSSSITSWQIDGETMEAVIDFIFLVIDILNLSPKFQPLRCLAWVSLSFFQLLVGLILQGVGLGTS